MVQSLCAIVLLEACSLRQAFAQFLLARKVGILESWGVGLRGLAMWFPHSMTRFRACTPSSEPYLYLRAHTPSSEPIPLPQSPYP